MLNAVSTITREELADHLRATFDRLDLVERGDVLATLTQRGVSPETIAQVAKRIPARARMANLRELWRYLSDVPLASARA